MLDPPPHCHLPSYAYVRDKGHLSMLKDQHFKVPSILLIVWVFLCIMPSLL